MGKGPLKRVTLLGIATIVFVIASRNVYTRQEAGFFQFSKFAENPIALIVSWIAVGFLAISAIAFAVTFWRLTNRPKDEWR